MKVTLTKMPEKYSFGVHFFLKEKHKLTEFDSN